MPDIRDKLGLLSLTRITACPRLTRQHRVWQELLWIWGDQHHTSQGTLSTCHASLHLPHSGGIPYPVPDRNRPFTVSWNRCKPLKLRWGLPEKKALLNSRGSFLTNLSRYVVSRQHYGFKIPLHSFLSRWRESRRGGACSSGIFLCRHCCTACRPTSFLVPVTHTHPHTQSWCLRAFKTS